MYAILLIFVVSFKLISSDVANVQQLLERVDVLERKLERVDELEMKLTTLSHAYESLLEDLHAQDQCDCSYLEEEIRYIGIIAAQNRQNILFNGDLIQSNEDFLQELATLIHTNEADIEKKVQSNTADIEVRQVQNQFCYIGKYMIFCYFRS